MFSYTIAIARCLLSEGRTRDIEAMLLPLLRLHDAEGMENREAQDIIRLRCMLAQTWLLSDQKHEEALQMLSPLATPYASASYPTLSRTLVLLWSGWAHILAAKPCQDIPFAIHLLRKARQDLLHLHRGDYLFWSYLGMALAFSKMREHAQMRDMLYEASTFAAFSQNVFARQWIDSLKDQAEDTPIYAHWAVMNTAHSMRLFLAQCRTIAQGSSSVLFTGERGVGKETSARMIHELSGYPDAHFECIDCEVIADNQFEVLDAFLANPDSSPQSALFLNHIEQLPGPYQERLLACIHSGRKTEAQPVSVRFPRIFAASSVELTAYVQEGTFNRALFNVLQTNTLHIPPLRSRKSDIPLLVSHFARTLCPIGVPFVGVTDAALTAMVHYEWPGNIRQLRNEMERAIAFVTSEPVPVVDLRILPDTIKKQPPTTPATIGVALDALSSEHPLDDALASTEKRIIEDVLASNHGQVSLSATHLGLTRQGLYKKIKRLGIRVSQFQDEVKKRSNELWHREL